ncbi:MAG: hypothetical protein HRU32_09300 [Rhodobacteraceae bacterium]|nr:hypothetical protein [Paracoccaceae bacterium]
MRTWLRTHPLTTAMIALAVYFAIFVVRGLASDNAFGNDEDAHANVIDLSQILLEIVLAGSVIGFILWLGWGREARVTAPLHWGGLWYVLPPALITLMLLGFGILAATETGLPDTFTLNYVIGILFLTALVGIFE